MRIAVLSAGDGWHVRDLIRAADQLGHQAEAVDFRRLSAAVGISGEACAWQVTANGNTFLSQLPPPAARNQPEAIVVRTMPPGSLEQVIFRMDLLQRLQAQGVMVLNPPRAVEICVDKYLTTALLDAAGLRVPATAVCQHADAALEAFHALGGDVIVKPLFGSEGRGMLRVSDPDLAWRTFRTLERTASVLYLQQVIAHPGWDLRIFVLGSEILAAMKRSKLGDWRTNVAQGGTAEPFVPGPEEARLALEATERLGVLVAGVDLLPAPDGGWYVLEVNAVPGWRALASVSGIDVARAIVQFLDKSSKW